MGFVKSNQLVRSTDLNDTALAIMDNAIQPHIETYIAFPKVALARATTTKNSTFKDKYTIIATKVGCGCNQQTIKEIVYTEGAQLNGIYAMELSGLFEPFDFTAALTQAGVISSEPFIESSTTVNTGSGTATARGIKSLITTLRDVRKYQVNTIFFGSFHTYDTIIDVGFNQQASITGIAKLSTVGGTIPGLDQNNILVNQNIDISKTDSDVIYIAGRLLSSAFKTGILNTYQFDEIFSTQSPVKKDDVIQSINAVLTDWKNYSEQNKYIIDMYVCHYNCYMDSSDSGGGESGVDCYSFTTTNINNSTFRDALFAGEDKTFKIQTDDKLMIADGKLNYLKAKWTNTNKSFEVGTSHTMGEIYNTKYGGSLSEKDSWYGLNIGYASCTDRKKCNPETTKLRNEWIRRWCEAGGDPSIYWSDSDTSTLIYYSWEDESYKSSQSVTRNKSSKLLKSYTGKVPTGCKAYAWCNGSSKDNIGTTYKFSAAFTPSAGTYVFHALIYGSNKTTTSWYQENTAEGKSHVVKWTNYYWPIKLDGTALKDTNYPDERELGFVNGSKIITQWADSKGNVVGNAGDRIESAPGKALYGIWADPQSYAITFDLRGGSGSAATQYVYEKQKVIRPANPTPPTDHQVFTDWCTDSGGTSPYDFNEEVYNAFTLYAGWNLKSYTVTFDTHGGSTVPSQSVQWNDLAMKPSPNPTKTGYDFEDWFSTDTYLYKFDFATIRITTDITLHAKWNPQTYTVQFIDRGEQYGDLQSVTYPNKVIRPADPIYEGYRFAGWYTDASLTVLFDFNNTIITSNTQIFAGWDLV